MAGVGSHFYRAVKGLDPFSPEEVRAAVGASVLAGVPEELRSEILADVTRSETVRGRQFGGPPLALLLSGLVRVSLVSSSGRRYAVSYLRRGDIVGLARLTGRRYPLSFEGVTDCRMLRLNSGAFDELRRRRPELGVAVAAQLNRHIDEVLNETALAAFGHVRQRVVRHVLALAVINADGPATCEITHHELADAVGSARETVARTISELRAEGLLAGDHGVLVIPDPHRLRRELTE